jgi:crotonobetainyl-CoA:carnitine CoA-transferase CaiB-like acyl-CoA transferase
VCQHPGVAESGVAESGVAESGVAESGVPDSSVTAGPLSDLLVADFSRVLAGPYATMLLADMGATVLKVENPNGGDDTRSWGPPWSDGLSTYFQAVNRNKRSFVCDLRVEQDRRVARELCGQADVIVENFRSGTTEKLGLDPGQVLADNPRAVYCSITGFGSGAGKELLGYDFLVQALGGLMSVTGEPDGPPMKVGVAIVDVITGLHALAGILAALHHRERTGQGQRIEVNLMSSLLSALVNQASSYLNTGTAPLAMGNQHPSIAPYEMVEASDRPLVLAVGNDSQFRALCAELGLDALADDPRFATNDVRVAHRDVLVSVMNGVFRTERAGHWVARLKVRGVPCGPVNGIDEAVALAGDLGLDPFVDLTRSNGTTSRQVRHPISYGTTPATYAQAPPQWDEVMGPAELSSFLESRRP